MNMGDNSVEETPNNTKGSFDDAVFTKWWNEFWKASEKEKALDKFKQLVHTYVVQSASTFSDMVARQKQVVGFLHQTFAHWQSEAQEVKAAIEAYQTSVEDKEDVPIYYFELLDTGAASLRVLKGQRLSVAAGLNEQTLRTLGEYMMRLGFDQRELVAVSEMLAYLSSNTLDYLPGSNLISLCLLQVPDTEILKRIFVFNVLAGGGNNFTQDPRTQWITYAGSEGSETVSESDQAQSEAFLNLKELVSNYQNFIESTDTTTGTWLQLRSDYDEAEARSVARLPELIFAVASQLAGENTDTQQKEG